MSQCVCNHLWVVFLAPILSLCPAPAPGKRNMVPGFDAREGMRQSLVSCRCSVHNTHDSQVCRAFLALSCRYCTMFLCFTGSCSSAQAVPAN